MKLRHHDTTDQAPSQETWSPAPGRVTRSEMLPAAGLAQPVQASPEEAQVEHEDPFAMHLIGAPVQMRGEAASPDDVHAAASHGIGGPGCSLPYLEQIQASFGLEHDVSHIQAHVGGSAAQASASMGAQAYATGNHVAFAGAPDLHTAAHEAAHVVQQRGGVQLAGGVGAVGDRYEQHADQVAEAVVRGDSAADLLGSGAAARPSSGVVQRFAADEHQMLGNDGSGNSMVELAPGYSLPFGDVVALAGDHFESIDQMRQFAKNVDRGKESRAEIEWARIWKLKTSEGPIDPKAWHDLEAREAQEQRYYQLAGRNQSHFLAPRGQDRAASKWQLSGVGNDRAEIAAARLMSGVPKNAPEGYRVNHIRALFEAVEAASAAVSGAAATSSAAVPTLATAHATEAFACHYLTDSFAGGHVRTARADLKTHWDPKVPMFSYNLVGLIADLIAHDVVNRGLYGTFNRRFLASQTRGTLESELAKKASFTLGDVVAGALHHRDNYEGVHVKAGGEDAHLLGDDQLLQTRRMLSGRKDPKATLQAARQTRRLATKAVELGVTEVRQAHVLGLAPDADPVRVIESYLDSNEGLFAAETLVPDPTTIDETQSPEAKWEADSIDVLFKDPVFASGAAVFLSEQAGELREIAEGLGGAQEQAVKHGVIEELMASPVDLLRRAVHWTPGAAIVQTWDAKDDSSDYIDEASKRHAVDTLTLPQRLKLMKTLTEEVSPESNPTPESEGRPSGSIMEILESSSKEDARTLIVEVGYDKILRWLSPFHQPAFEAKYPRDDHAPR